MSDAPELFDAGLVSGTVAYRERIAMPSGSVLTVSLLDVSRADAPADVISQIEVPEPGNVPIDFELVYDPDAIVARHHYVVRATIVVAGRLSWTTDTAHHVITDGHPNEIALWLVRA